MISWCENESGKMARSCQWLGWERHRRKQGEQWGLLLIHQEEDSGALWVELRETACTETVKIEITALRAHGPSLSMSGSRKPSLSQRRALVYSVSST